VRVGEEVEVDEQVLVSTRRALHAVAESVLAGPQYRAEGTIRLQVTPGGFGQVAGPLRVEGTAAGVELVGAGAGVPLRGTLVDLAAAVGVEAQAPDLYHDHADLDPEAELAVDPAAAALLLDWFARADAAMRRFAPDQTPVLWPEHFDLGIALDEVNYGASPGDAGHPAPYAYVGPWTPREGAFWNAPFGALRPADRLPDATAAAAFFAEGRAAAASD
jgi:hypothetical protein